jgi:squalene synthase HpnC
VVDLEAAYASCARDARRHYENFPVASLLVPRATRPHIAALYAFARAADDFADEGERPASERLRLLDRWRDRLHRAVGQGEQLAAEPGEPDHAPAIFTALGATIATRALPVDLFEDLLDAFRQDVQVRRYESWPDVLDYCRRSANPVGRLVLRIAGMVDARLDAWSDAICTALQLTNFWQDLGIDAARGRIYVPVEDMDRHGAAVDALAVGALPEAWRRVMREMTSRTRALFVAGRPLCDAVHGRLRYELRATWLGGMRILDKLEAASFDPIARRPRLGAGDVPLLAARLALSSLNDLRPHFSRGVRA